MAACIVSVPADTKRGERKGKGKEERSCVRIFRFCPSFFGEFCIGKNHNYCIIIIFDIGIFIKRIGEEEEERRRVSLDATGTDTDTLPPPFLFGMYEKLRKTVYRRRSETLILTNEVPLRYFN